MCGIAGWIAFGEQRPSSGTASLLLLSLKERGKNASGITYAPKWNCRLAGYIKHHLPAESFVTEGAVQKHLNAADTAQICFVHTRFTTKGDEKRNANNHPVFREGGKYILVHNGQVANDDEIFKKLEVTRQAEVDTEALAILLDSGNLDASQARNRLRDAGGTYSLAAFTREKPNHVILIRRENPLYYAISPKKDLFAFGSTIEAALLPFRDDCELQHRGLEIPNLPIPVSLSDNFYLIMGPEGLIEKGEHKVTPQAEESEKKDMQRIWTAWEKDWGYNQRRSQPSPNNTRFALPSGGSNRMPFNVSSSLSFAKPSYLSKTPNLHRFATGPFPIVGQREEAISAKCPDCWEWVNAQELVKDWKCPQCMSKFVAPTVFRALRPSEEQSGKIYLG